MIRYIAWFKRYQTNLLLIMSLLVILFAVIAHMSIEERLASEKIHAKLDYEAQLFKFLLIERSCGCNK